jgi:hypothetical protein
VVMTHIVFLFVFILVEPLIGVKPHETQITTFLVAYSASTALPINHRNLFNITQARSP